MRHFLSDSTHRIGSKTAGSSFLVASGLSAGYGARPVVKDVSLSTELGEMVCIVGPNGAGKSTLLKTLAGVLRPMSGSLLLAGFEVTGASSDHLTSKGLGYVPQVDDVFETMTVRENLEMGGFLLEKRKLKDRIEEILTIMPLLNELRRRTASSLSGGERKFLAIARALMLEPKMLLLDEPTANLSPEASIKILDGLLRGLADAGTGILFIEQKVEHALTASDRGYVLVGGQVALEGPALELEEKDLGEVFLGGTKE